MAKFVCPYCIRDYSLRKVLYVCPDCGKASLRGRFEKEPVKCKNKRCGNWATQRKCPLCGEEIPKMALETPNLPFSIVGVSNSGKTNFITVMLQELGKASGLRLALGSQNKYTKDHQNENYTRIYEQHSPPESTAGGESSPQIWYIKNLLKKRKDYVPTYTFTIFDGAGEDHENKLDTSSTVCRYISASKAVVITLDPLILSSIRKGNIVDPLIMKNSLGGHAGETKNAADIVNSLAYYIKTAKGIKVEKLLPIPAAIVLTKFDTILSHKTFGPNALIKSSSLTIRESKVNMGEMQQVDQEIRNWLQEIGEESFINALEANFKEFYFFGVSSYGEPPKSANSLSEHIRPHRILDPILWLFKKAKFID
jgi:hypothetical protein